MINTPLSREVGVWGRNNSFFANFEATDPNSVKSWFLFNDGVGALPTESINGITAASNTGTYTTRANQKYQGVEYVKASSQLTDFGTSTGFLPDPSIDNEVTFDLMVIPNRIGESETHSIWCKGSGAVDNSSFCFLYNTSDQPVAIFRYDAEGEDEDSGLITASTVTLVEGDLYHWRLVYDGNKTLGVHAALYINDMTVGSPKGTFADPAGTLAGIENTTSFNMHFALDGLQYGEITVIEAMVRTGLHTEQVL